jgi:peptidoglycan/xylan/chitin deacetylase (PgdA/CDA1 family)
MSGISVNHFSVIPVVSHPPHPSHSVYEIITARIVTEVELGHEIGSHTINHKQQPIMADSAFEAAESKRLIEGWMEREIPSFSYPFYRTIQHLKQPVIKAGYQQARTGPQKSYYASPDSVDWFAVDCRQIMRAGEVVTTWVKPGSWHVLTFHGIGQDQDGWEPVTETEFARQMAELAKLRDSGAVEVVTFKDGADRLRQPSLH